MSGGSRAVFMDRDGTVCEEVGYVNHPSRCRLLPRSAEAIRVLNGEGFKTVIVTNQAGVARGYFEEEMIGRVHERLRGLLEAEGARVDAIYYCAHHPDVGDPPYRLDCDCRKPRPGLLRRGASDLGLDLSSSYMIGDSVKDVQAADRAGATGILVLTGYGLGEWESRRERFRPPPAHVANDLLDAARWILERERGRNG
jgi:D-glycero-D-manno-heptose 1,7-bisphosphate phosphatase